jgi:hypothetical protein
VDAQASLDAGRRVGRDDELVLARRLPLLAPLVQVQDPTGLDLEVRIARQDPAAVLPRADGVFVQPSPTVLSLMRATARSTQASAEKPAAAKPRKP